MAGVKCGAAEQRGGWRLCVTQPSTLRARLENAASVHTRLFLQRTIESVCAISRAATAK